MKDKYFLTALFLYKIQFFLTNKVDTENTKAGKILVQNCSEKLSYEVKIFVT